MELTKGQIQERAINYLNAKIFFAEKELEQRKLEADGVIPTFIDHDVVVKQIAAEERKVAMLKYLFDITLADVEKKIKKKCGKTCTGCK
jgi:protocatechuate 3,4-dioxygenase beta subunit